MAERIEGLSIELDLETMKVNSGLEDLKSKLKTVNSEMKANMSAFDRSDRSIGKYETRLSGLNKKLEVQRAVTDRAYKSYEKMVKEHGEGSTEAEKATREYNNQAAALNNLERYVEGVTDELEQMKEQQRITESGWTKMGDHMVNAGDKMQTFGRGMTNFGKEYSMKVTAPIVAGGVAVFKTASDFESAFAGVAKTFSGTDKQLADLRVSIRDMAKEIPASTTEIAAVAEAAGQLGIETENIESFTRTMIDLGEATNMTSEVAATEFARFANIVGMSQDDFDKLGSSVVALGNSMATTEAEISSMAMRLAAQGSQVGMSEAQIMALSATMSSLGIEAEAGGTAMTTVLKKIDKAVGEGGESLSEFAKASGASSKEFSDAWNKDPIVALDMFIKGLANSGDEGKNLTTILEDLGIKGIREADTILRMAGASDLLTDAVETSSDAWEENSALTDEAAQRYATTESKLKILWNRVKDMGITLGEALIPVVMDLLDAAEPLIQKIEDGSQAFADMDEEQQKTILKMIGLAAAIGPVSIGVGQLTTGIGGLLTVTGNLSKSIGVASGKGTAGALSLLGKAGVAGLAIAGIAGVTLAVIDLIKDSKELDEVNLDVAQSLSDQASELENSANTFDKLAGKAKISNEQLAELNDLNIRISESSNPGEINELQKQYDNLAKKSGLSKDELKKLFDANADIIEQSPNVQTSVSETGNAFAENTDAVREYINSLHEATLIELEAERTKSLEQEKEIRQEITNKQNELNGLLEQMGVYTDSIKLSEDEIASRIEEINGLYRDSNLSVEEKNQLQLEQTALLDIQSGKYAEAIEYLQAQVEKKRESIGNSEEELEKINALNEQMANLVLKQAGINESGEKGLAQLDAALVKNAEELEALEQKRIKNGELTEEEQKRYEKLVETNAKQQEAKQYLFEELGVYKDINSLLEGKLSHLSQEEQQKINNLAKTTEIKVEEGNIVSQIEKKNEKLLEERANLEANRQKQGANKEEIDKQIAAIDSKITKNDSVLVQILKESGLWDDVKDAVNLGSNAIDNQGGKIDNNNSKTRKGIDLEKDRTKEAGKDVDKDVTVKDNGTVADLNKRSTEKKDKFVAVKDNGTIDTLNLGATAKKTKLVILSPGSSLSALNRQASNPVTKVINFVGRGLSKLKFWAKGTDNHPGGPAVMGDGIGSNAGRELVTLPGGKMFFSADRPTIYPYLPKGTKVMPARETKKVLKNIPKYAEGTNNWQGLLEPANLRNNEFMTLLALLGKDSESKINIKEQSTSGSNSAKHMEKIIEKLSEQVEDTKEVVSLLAQLLLKNSTIVMNDREVGRILEPVVTERQSRNKRLKENFL